VRADGRGTLVANGPRVLDVRRVQLELLTVVVHGHVARELQLPGAPVDGAPPQPPHDRPGGGRQPHGASTGHGCSRSTSSTTSAPQPGPSGTATAPSPSCGTA